jgi:hypothetical protein
VPERLRRSPTCLDCGAPTPDAWCPECGQRNADLRAPVSALAGELVAESFSLDSRMGRTAWPFLARPGFLTAEWVAGRRTRYSSPVRLYLLTSLLFFLGASIEPGPREVDVAPGEEARDRAELDEARASVERLGAVGRYLAERIAALQRIGPEEARRRLSDTYRANAPRVAFFLVPWLALLLAAAYRKERRYFAEHAVFSLHAHSFAFVVLTPVALLGGRGQPVALAALVAYLALALHRVHGGWRRTALVLPALVLGYAAALAAGVAAVAFVSIALL